MNRKCYSWLIILLCFIPAKSTADDRYVDYRFAPAWQEITTALPSDKYKTLVGPQGQLLYEYGESDFFAVTGKKQGFKTVIQMLADEDQKFESLTLHSAKVPVVVLKSSKRTDSIEQIIFSTSADIRNKRSHTSPAISDREDVVLSTIHNNSGEVKTYSPKLVLNSLRNVSISGQTVVIDSLGSMTLSLPIKRVRQNLSAHKTIVDLEDISLAPAQEYSIAGIFDNGLESSLVADLANKGIGAVKIALQSTVDFWNNRSDIPYGLISVPDTEIQNLLDASIRGIWQAREYIDGRLSLQVGPTCYRGLWLVDGAFLSEATAMLGCGKDARSGIEYSLSFQKESGEFAKLSRTFWKENGVILWTCVRHAMLTQDKDWLLSKWETLSKTVSFIGELRARTLLNDMPEDDGLIEPGYIDGGLNGSVRTPEYSNTLWNLTGLKAMIGAALWLGKSEDAAKWQAEYDDFYACFRKAAERDLAVDDFGNNYLNNIMLPAQRDLPQRAQWTFCQSVYPGQLFEPGDSIANGTLDMLETTLQEGSVMGTGWIVEGIWNYFSSFYGHAQLWTGHGDKAADALYAFANHASTTYSWREEHNPRDLDDAYVGDMPHNWASAEFVRLASHLLQIDRGTELHLLEGIPQEWLGPGMHTKIAGMATPFGALFFSLDVNSKGNQATLRLHALEDNCSAVVVHTGKWGNSKQGSNTIRLNPKQNNTITINIKQ